MKDFHNIEQRHLAHSLGEKVAHRAHNIDAAVNAAVGV